MQIEIQMISGKIVRSEDRNMEDMIAELQLEYPDYDDGEIMDLVKSEIDVLIKIKNEGFESMSSFHVFNEGTVLCVNPQQVDVVTIAGYTKLIQDYNREIVERRLMA